MLLSSYPLGKFHVCFTFLQCCSHCLLAADTSTLPVYPLSVQSWGGEGREGRGGEGRGGEGRGGEGRGGEGRGGEGRGGEGRGGGGEGEREGRGEGGERRGGEGMVRIMVERNRPTCDHTHHELRCTADTSPELPALLSRSQVPAVAEEPQTGNSSGHAVWNRDT